MKATIRELQPVELFKPLTLEITIESPEELQALWWRFNQNHLLPRQDELDCCTAGIKPCKDHCGNTHRFTDSEKTVQIWDMLDIKAEQYGYVPGEE